MKFILNRYHNASLQYLQYCVVWMNNNEEVGMEELDWGNYIKMNDFDWENNKDAIGCFVSNGGMKTFYVKTKVGSDFTSGELTDGWQGLMVDGREYHVFTKYWDYVEKPKEGHSECHTDEKGEQRKLIILNAPKNCGKDVVAEHLVNMYNFHHVEFKAPVEKLVKSFYSLTDKEHELLYRRENKEVPQSYLMNKSIRDCYIHVSENVIKPMFGRDVFGVLLADSLQSGVSVSSDGGFTEEISAVAEVIGEENILIIQIHAEGRTFDGDSRDYLYVDGVRTVSVNNLFTPQFFEDVERAVNNWLEDER